MFNPLDLSGKLILVTGASSGIGRATAITLSRLGASVILSGRREEELRVTLEMADKASRIYIDPFDLSDTDAIPSWMNRLCMKYDSSLQGIVHAAGFGVTFPIRASNRKKIDEVMSVNVYASIGLLHGISMKAIGGENGCSVVFISSVAGFAGAAGKTVYCGSKAALHIIAKSAAIELALKRIRVNCIAPGWVDTPMLQKALCELPEGVKDLQNRQVLGLIPPEEVGIAAAYLISDAARHITGTTLVLDGGYTC
jgi:NAD(P)-dependent dehydrogenase (short-subunit alcohol dehydrogenase family)